MEKRDEIDVGMYPYRGLTQCLRDVELLISHLPKMSRTNT